MGNDSGLIVFSLFIGSINQALAKLTTLTAQLGRKNPSDMLRWVGWNCRTLGFYVLLPFFWGGGRLLFVCLKYYPTNHLVIRFFEGKKPDNTNWCGAMWQRSVSLFLGEIRWYYRDHTFSRSNLWARLRFTSVPFYGKKHMFFRHLGLNKMLRWKLSLSIIPADWRN